MTGSTRGPITLLAAGAAGALIWAATQIGDGTLGGYWAVYSIVAAAGFVMAASQLAGGWTKGGGLRVSPLVLLLAFAPALIAIGWIVVAGQPGRPTTRSHVLTWSDDLAIGGIVRDLLDYVGVLAFGLGLLLGFSFDTTGPIVETRPSAELRDWRHETAVTSIAPPPAAYDGDREPVAVGPPERAVPR